MILRSLSIGCLMYAALAVQPSLGFLPFRLWLPGIAMTAAILWFDGTTSLLWAALIGLGVDCLSGERLGIHLVAATVSASVLVLLRGNSTSRNPAAAGIFAGLGTFLWRCTTLATREFLNQSSFDAAVCAKRALLEAFTTGLLFFAGLLVYRFLVNAVRPRQTASVSLTNRWSMLTGT